MKLNLGSYLTILSALTQLPTIVNNTVVEVENMLGGVPGITGSSKLAAAEAKVNSILQAAIDDAGLLDTAKAIVVPLINAAVAMFNAAGLFKKAAPANTAA